jgi:NADH-quinone oxidoreductase subunit G
MRKAVLNGARLATVNPYELPLNFPADQFVDTPVGMLRDLAAIAKSLRKRGSGTVKDLIAQAEPDQHHAAVAEGLKSGGKGRGALILVGALAAAHPDYTLLKAFAQVIAEATKARVGFLPAAANAVGAHLAGALPHVLPGAAAAEPPGADALAMLTEPRRGYLLWGLEPAYDLIDPAAADAAFGRADFVVACTAYRAPSIEAAADLMLPIGGFAETSGTFVNAEATWQGFRGAVAPPGEARPGWKVLRVLGNLLGLDGFDYVSSAEICDEVRAASEGVKPGNDPRGDLKSVSLAPPAEGLYRIGDVPIYALDALVRRAPALQRTPSAGAFGVYLNPEQASALGLADGDEVAVRQNGAVAAARVSLDSAVPPGCARIPAAVAGSEALGLQIGVVSVEKA